MTLTKKFILEHYGTFSAAARAAREKSASKLTANALRNSPENLSAERSAFFAVLIKKDCTDRLAFLENENGN